MEEVRVEELLTTINTLMLNKDYATLREALTDIYPMDLAEILEDLSPDDCLILFRLLHKDRAAEVFSYLDSQRRGELASSIQGPLLEHIFSELDFDDKIDFLGEMPANFVKNLIGNAPPEERAMINQFLLYPDNSAGSLMTIEYVDLKKQMTAAQAMARIREIGSDTETIHTCYVLDDTRHLEGIVSLRRLVLSQGEQLVEELMRDVVVLCGVHDDQEDVAEQFKKYDLMAIPVVDGEKRLVGIITIDDIVDVIEQENTEDFQKMAAMAPNDEEYMKTGVFKLAKHRIVWLLVLMVSATLTGGIITRYEGLLSTVVVLTAFIPMLMDSGGNAGSQSSTLIIRGIALGEIQLRDWVRVLWKELRVGVVAGAALGVVNYVRMLLMGQGDALVAFTVSVTLLLTIVLAKVVGGILPMAAKALRLDPAIMAGPLITTIVDAVSLFIYFGIASALIL